jgi:hypothetical protein
VGDRPPSRRCRRWISGTAGQTRAEQRRVLAVDGKTLRGSGATGAEQIKLIGVYDHASGLVLTQAAVADGDEIAAFTVALTCLSGLGGC